jgi:AraC-like DNA-binding protein
MKKKFHLYHISFLDSLFKGLSEAGVPVDDLMSRSMLKRFDVSNTKTYLPIFVYYEFIDLVKRKLGIDHIAGEFYGRFRLGDLSDFGQFLTHCPDLLSILQNGIKYNYQVQTNGKLKLEIHGAISHFSMHHLDPPSVERLISEKIELSMMLKAFQLVLGNNWEPLQLHLTTNDGQWLGNIIGTSNLKIFTKQPVMKIVFKTEELISRNPQYTRNSRISDKEITSTDGAIFSVLQSMKAGYIPTLYDISDYFGFSNRTIIRGLKESGKSYQDLLQKHLFFRSLELLQKQQLTIHNIGTLLGYSNTPNFIRAFKKWTSVTPDQYRKQALHYHA